MAPKKMTTESFIERCKNNHNKFGTPFHLLYDYSKTIYTSQSNKVTVTCKTHGDFQVIAGHHLYKSIGCKLCSNNSRIIISTEEWVQKVLERFPANEQLYDYTHTIYEHSELPLNIRCKRCGTICNIIANNHLQTGKACTNCEKINRFEKAGESFVTRSNQLFHNKYDYSKVRYKGSAHYVTVICPLHGDFLITPANHLAGKGCPECAKQIIIEKQSDTTEDFIRKARELHGDRYDYSQVNYINSQTKVEIVCKEHGSFFMRPNKHLSSRNDCPFCMGKIYTTENFIQKAKERHDALRTNFQLPLYDYTPTVFTHSQNNVVINCPLHGDFVQQASAHLSGQGCPTCAAQKSISKFELEVREFVKSITEDTPLYNKRLAILNGQELDIYISAKQIVAIECNGIYYHSDQFKSDSYHQDKLNLCELNGIQLIQIFEDEWIHKQDIVKSRLKHILSCSDSTVYARKCVIKQVPKEQERTFLDENHIQGYIASQLCYGLYFNDNLIALMSFGQLRINLGNKNSSYNDWELYRYVTEKNTSVVGGASKLFKHFLRRIRPNKVVSYADRRFTTTLKPTVYSCLGFERVSFTPPNYYYVNGTKRENRFKYRKDILVSKYNCPQEVSEREFTRAMGLNRIYDAGNIKYELKPQIYDKL